MTPNVLESFEAVRQTGSSRWMARCPAHDDRHGSLSIAEADDGRILLRCHAGCETADVLDRAGLDWEDLFPDDPDHAPDIPRKSPMRAVVAAPPARPAAPAPKAPPAPLPGCTLAAYAREKRLPVEFLCELGLREDSYADAPAIRIPYRDEAGTLAATRYRTALEKSDSGPDQRFRWAKGATLLPYGLWRLDLARQAGYAVVVEGESDAHTLWLHGIPAIGIPGASNWRNAWADPLAGVATLYVVQEPDKGGETLREALRRSPLAGRVKVVHLGEVKDPSGLHVADPERFQARWQAAMEAAQPLIRPDASGPVEEPPDEDAVSPEPLRDYLRHNDAQRERIKKRGVQRGKAYEQALADGISEAIAAEVAEHILIGKNLRRREDAKARDTIARLGEWYAQLPNYHTARPYIVARTFGLPYMAGRIWKVQHPVLRDKMNELQGYARIFRAFGNTIKEEDAPPRLFKEVASLKDSASRAKWIAEWTEGHGTNIYQRLREEKRQIREREEAEKQEEARLRAEFSGQVDTTTGEMLTPMIKEDPSHGAQLLARVGEAVAVQVPADWAAVLPAMIAAAERQGLTPAEALLRITLDPAEQPSETAPNDSTWHENVYTNHAPCLPVLDADENAQNDDTERPLPADMEAPAEDDSAPAHAVVQERVDPSDSPAEEDDPDGENPFADEPDPPAPSPPPPVEDALPGASALLERLRDGRERGIGALLDDGFPIDLIDTLTARGLLVKRRVHERGCSVLYRLAGPGTQP